jgi:fatty acid desaturase
MLVGGPKLGALRIELATAGVFEHREIRSWLKLGVLLSGVAAGLTAIALVGWWIAIPVVPILSVMSTSIAMFGHEGSHRSFSSSPVRNAIVAYFTFPVFGGLSTLYWREKHDRLHHGHPNVEGVDPDIRPFPFASSRGDHEKCTKNERWFQRNFQRWLFWPMSTLMAVGMRRSSLVHLGKYAKANGFDRAWWIEVGCLVVHYIGWLLVPSLIWGPLVGFALYSAIWSGVGVCLALVFAPAHIGLPILRSQNHDWIHQLETTRNLEMPRLYSYFFIGLDYQVEHHLFPKIPHHNLPRAAAITAAWCRREGVIYQSEPYPHALADAARFMADAWSREAMDPIEVRAGIVGRAAPD